MSQDTPIRIIQLRTQILEADDLTQSIALWFGLSGFNAPHFEHDGLLTYRKVTITGLLETVGASTLHQFEAGVHWLQSRPYFVPHAPPGLEADPVAIFALSLSLHSGDESTKSWLSTLARRAIEGEADPWRRALLMAAQLTLNGLSEFLPEDLHVGLWSRGIGRLDESVTTRARELCLGGEAVPPERAVIRLAAYAAIQTIEASNTARRFISDFRRNGDELRTVAGLVRANRLMPFVGAGLSIPCGYPGWSAFLIAEADASGLGNEVRSDITAGAFEMAAERLLNRQGEFAFDRRIQHVYGIARELRGAVQLLPRIASNSVVTTNFDDVIERVFLVDRRQLSAVAGARFVSVAHAMFGTRPHLLKMHGDAHDVSDRVLTYSEYQRHYGDGPPWRMDLPIALSRLFSSVSLLFLGCSLSTDRTIAILGQAALVPAAPTHFAIVEAPTDPAACDERQRELGAHRIAPIWYPHGEHQWVSVLLEVIASEAGR